eukprot:TRINITY_DN17408_c0_g1_i1.p1 TRINITY_DN17408_c0_g1~~TRINITY_DN17408_c0_g1_i1.p1  ORF type:complete len:582 (+),score=201.99 TRINITY_DN17408_c0_g1_i1:122-1867(+)
MNTRGRRAKSRVEELDKLAQQRKEQIKKLQMQNARSQAIAQQNLSRKANKGAIWSESTKKIGRKSEFKPSVSSRRRTSIQKPALDVSKADRWTTKEVCRWLGSLGLASFADVFIDNQINGKVLLMMQQEDFDYLGVKKLGHRKILQHGIETLKNPELLSARGNRMESEMPKPRSVAPKPIQQPSPPRIPVPKNRSSKATSFSSTAPPTSNDMLTSRSQLEELPAPENSSPESKMPEKKMKHWSQIKPIAENEVEGGELPVNLADGQYDERGAHLSFLAALDNWRNGVDSDDEDAGAANDGGWVNPFAADVPPEPEEGGGALLNGDFNEEEEHLAFMEAVNAWRTKGSNADGTSEDKTKTTEGTGEGSMRRGCYSCMRTFFEEIGFSTSGLPNGSDFKDKYFCSEECFNEYKMELEKHNKTIITARSEKSPEGELTKELRDLALTKEKLQKSLQEMEEEENKLNESTEMLDPFGVTSVMASESKESNSSSIEEPPMDRPVTARVVINTEPVVTIPGQVNNSSSLANVVVPPISISTGSEAVIVNQNDVPIVTTGRRRLGNGMNVIVNNADEVDHIMQMEINF